MIGYPSSSVGDHIAGFVTDSSSDADGPLSIEPVAQ